MICPCCNKEFVTTTVPAEYNVLSYGEPVRVRADCCGNLVTMSRIQAIRLEEYHGKETKDSWLR